MKYYLQNIEDDEYTENEAAKVESTGTTEGTATAEQKAFEGFTFDEEASTMTGTIAGDGSLVLEAYYTRNEYSVTFNTNGGSAVAAITGRYGSTVGTPGTTTKAGYDFDGWDDLPLTIPVGGKTVNAQWAARNDTAYTVK